jgi:tetratricopeptide (TPR) repeat protein
MSDATEWLTKAEGFEAAQDWRQAAMAYGQALTHDPNNVEAENALGMVWEELGNTAQAEGCYAAALRLDPSFTAARYNLAMLYKECGQRGSAIQEFERLLPLLVDQSERAEVEQALAELRAPERKRCDKCGRTSPLAEFYRMTWGGLLCPRCYARNRSQKGRQWTRWALVVALVGFGLALLPSDGLRSWHFYLLNTVLVFGLIGLLVVPHELAHGLAAWLVGGRVYAIRLGAGPALFQVTILGVDVTVRRWLFEGHCLAVVTGGRALRWRWLCVYSAGLLVSVAIIVILLPGLHLGRMVSEYALRECLVLASLWHLIAGFAKGQALVEGRPARSDGMHIRSLLSRAWRPDTVRSAYQTAEAQWAWQKGDYLRCRKAAEHGLVEHPDDFALKCLRGLALLGLEQHDEALAVFEGLLATATPEAVGQAMSTPAQREVVRAGLVNNIAYAMLVANRSKGGLQLAYELAEEAYGLTPWSPFVEATWGTVLAECGHVEDGLRHLHDAYENLLEPWSRGSVSACIAMAYARIDQPDQARSFLATAIRLAPREPMVKKAMAEVGVS